MKKQDESILKIAAKSQAGFSLLEILIALTLMGIAGTFVAGKIFDQLHEGRVKASKIQMDALKNQLQQYRRKCFTYPTSAQGLEALVTKPAGGGRECKDYPPNGFIEEVPLDPWDNEYAYISDGKDVNIVSYGADGMEGGEGEDKDISLKDKK